MMEEKSEGEREGKKGFGEGMIHPIRFCDTTHELNVIFFSSFDSFIHMDKSEPFVVIFLSRVLSCPVSTSFMACSYLSHPAY